MKKYAIKFFAVLFAFSVLLTACSGSGGLGGEKLNVNSGEIQFAKPRTGDTVAVIHTSEGDIKVLLFPEIAPKAVYNFVTLAENGYYDNTVFHRVISDFMIQGGSPDGSADGGTSCWGLEFEDEFSDLLHHYNGALSMANHGQDTNGSQFFFVTSPIGEVSANAVSGMENGAWRGEVVQAYKEAGGLPSLDYRYTVFGQIYDGLNIAYKISRRETDENERPKKDVTIESIEIFTVE